MTRYLGSYLVLGGGGLRESRCFGGAWTILRFLPSAKIKKGEGRQNQIAIHPLLRSPGGCLLYRNPGGSAYRENTRKRASCTQTLEWNSVEFDSAPDEHFALRFHVQINTLVSNLCWDCMHILAVKHEKIENSSLKIMLWNGNRSNQRTYLEMRLFSLNYTGQGVTNEHRALDNRLS